MAEVLTANVDRAEVEIQSDRARSILEYTGLTGNNLEIRMEKFNRHYQGKGFYKEEDIIRKSELINDPIYGAVKLHPLLECIINTPEFYRLKNVKQLGGVCHVYPGSNHTRFEHSIGVSYIAGEFIHHLLQQHPSESNIDQNDILCVKVAGLCHDLGQGPFSHVFEELVVNKILDKEQIPERWRTKMSKLIFKKILQDRPKVLTAFVRSGLRKRDVQFIEEMIEHDDDDFRPEGRSKEKQRFLYEIVINRKTGIDAVKWDCLFRDCHYLGITINFQWRRLVELSYIVGGKGEMDMRHIGFRNKAVNDILEMFHMQCSLTRKAYKHKTVHAVEMMIAEAIVLCKDIDLIQVYENDLSEEKSRTYQNYDETLPVMKSESTSKAIEDESTCQTCAESLLAVKYVSVLQAVKSAFEAIRLDDAIKSAFKAAAIGLDEAVESAKAIGLDDSTQDYLQGYLALNDFILNQVTHISPYIRSQMSSQKGKHSPWSDWMKAHELMCRIEHRKLYKLAAYKTLSIPRKEVSNEKFYKVKTLQDLIARDQAKFKIASHCKSSPQFSPEDIHVEMVKVTFGLEEDKHPLKNVLFVPKDDLSKSNPNEFEKASALVSPQEFTEYQLRVFTKKNGLDVKVVEEAFTKWYNSESDLDYKFASKNTFSNKIIGEIETFECGPEGGVHILSDHDIQITVPPGAIERKIAFEFAVCLDGPFTLPVNKRPISPILWICTKGMVKEFNQPIEVVIPHIFPELSVQDKKELEIAFVKADHTIDFSISEEGSKSYTFKEIEEASFHVEGGKGSLSLYHCCYLCIEAKISKAVASKAAYCLTQFQSMRETRATVTFCATYWLTTCLKALKDQFSTQVIAQPKKFKFVAAQNEENQYLVMCVESGEIITTANPKDCKIFASEIDFWKKKAGECEDDLKLQHDLKMYPPRVIFEVDCSTRDTFKLNFNVSGCIDINKPSQDSDISFELMFPLIGAQTSSSTQWATELGCMGQGNITPVFKVSKLMLFDWIDKETSKRHTYRVLPNLKHKWLEIGYQLDIDGATMSSLRGSNDDDLDRLSKIIEEWIEKGNCEDQTYQPSWRGLYILLNDIEEYKKAEDLLKIFSTHYDYKLNVTF